MGHMERLAAVFRRESDAATEALESIKAMYGSKLAANAGIALHSWINLNVQISYALVLARVHGASMKTCETTAESLTRSTIDVMSHHFHLVMIDSGLPLEKREEVMLFLIRYLNRSILSANQALIEEFNRIDREDDE